MKKIIFITAVLFIPFLVQASNDHLWISQLQTTGGPGKTTNDFIEIYNPTSADIDLNGYRLVKRSETGTSDASIKSWTDSAIVKAGGYYLWANSNFTDLVIPPDITTSATISDNNAVALRNGPSDTGTIIDSVGWGSAINAFVEGLVFPTNPDPNKVLLRSQDTDNNSLDFTITDPTPRNSTSIIAPASDPTTDPVPEVQHEPEPQPEPVPQADPQPIPPSSPPPSSGGGTPLPPPVVSPTPTPHPITAVPQPKPKTVATPKIAAAATTTTPTTTPKIVTSVVQMPSSIELKVSGNVTFSPQNLDQPATLPMWLGVGFAGNLLFCYILVKLMTKG
jgi:hypothetical protein